MTRPLTSAEISALSPIAVLDRSPMALAVALATLAADKRHPIPILANVRVRGTANGLEFTGTDLDLTITARVAGAADERLDTTVPAHTLKKILDKTRASDMVSLKQTGGTDDDVLRCNVDLGGVVFDLLALPASDFPDGDFGDVKRSFEISGADLAALFDKTRKAMSTEDARYYLNGVYLHGTRSSLGNQVLRAVATDGHRLEAMEIPASEGSAGDWGVIVPSQAVKAVLEVFKIMKRANKGSEAPPVTVEINEGSRVRFQIGMARSVTVTSKLVDGTFPEYQRVVPRHNENVATVSAKAMAAAIEQVSILGDTNFWTVKLDVTPGKIVLSTNAESTGRASTSIEAALSGNELEIGFAATYLLDLLSEISGEDCTIAFGDHGSPALFTDPGDARWFGVLMPKRV